MITMDYDVLVSLYVEMDDKLKKLKKDIERGDPTTAYVMFGRNNGLRTEYREILEDLSFKLQMVSENLDLGNNARASLFMKNVRDKYKRYIHE